MAAAEFHVCFNVETYVGIEICNLVISSIGIIITIMLSIDALIQLPKQTKMKSIFKSMFWLSSSMAFITLFTSILATVFCVENMNKDSLRSAIFTVASYFMLLMTLLATLLLRLYSTFHGSAYEISYKQRCCLLIFYILATILGIITIAILCVLVYQSLHAEEWVNQHKYTAERTAISILGVLSGLIYIFLTCWIVYLFATKLLDVANLTVNDTEIDDEDECQVGAKQMKFIDSISRYVTLFNIAVTTTVIALIISFGGNWVTAEGKRHGQAYMCITGIDTVINMTCFYLQYQFNVKYYDTFCGCLACWKPYFIKKLQKNMKRAANNKSQQEASTPLKTNTDNYNIKANQDVQ